MIALSRGHAAPVRWRQTIILQHKRVVSEKTHDQSHGSDEAVISRAEYDLYV